ncbi:hypothetical protein BH10PSE16_BH10PSE16_40170 [soil metagenome]
MLSCLNRRWLPAVMFMVSSLVVSGAQAKEIRPEILLSGLQNPWALAFLPGGRFLVTERAGRLRLVEADDKRKRAAAVGGRRTA